LPVNPFGPLGQPQSEPVRTVRWFGASGTIYEFQLHDVGTAFKSRCGVYIFCRQINDGQYAPLYVGECDDFDGRVGRNRATHHKWQGVVTRGVSHVCTLFVPGDRAKRLRIEADLRQGLRPPLNDQ
jgi:hypothetical protein